LRRKSNEPAPAAPEPTLGRPCYTKFSLQPKGSIFFSIIKYVITTCGKRSKGLALGPVVVTGAGCAVCGAAAAGGFAGWAPAGVLATSGTSACSGIP